MGGFGGMLENDPTATRLVLMDSYGIGHTISVVRPIIGPMLRPLCSKNTVKGRPNGKKKLKMSEK